MKGAGLFLLLGLLFALALAVASPWASRSPDGLEKVSDEHGLAPVATQARTAPMENYWEEKGPAFKIVAGGVGTLLVFGVTLGLGRLLAKKKRA